MQHLTKNPVTLVVGVSNKYGDKVKFVEEE